MSESKKCSKCGEEILAEAKKCKHCGSDLRSWFARHPLATIILGIFFISVVISAMNGSGAPIPDTANKPASQNTKPIELSAANKKDLQGLYKQFINTTVNADKQFETWSKQLSNGASEALAYQNADVLIALNDKVRDDIGKLQTPAYLSDADKAKIDEAKSNLSTAYYTRNQGLEAGKKYLNTKDLEQLTKFKDKMSMASSFSMTGLAKFLEVLTSNKIEIPTS